MGASELGIYRMKSIGYWLLLIGLIAWVPVGSAATSITNGGNYSYGANLGWIDCRGNTNNGAVIAVTNAQNGYYYCAGYIYAANVGWISLGSGSPVNGYAYGNSSASDYGLNLDTAGNLRGYAYGANIGWINFENTGGARIDLTSGRFSGYAWSANCGWLSLSNTYAVLQTDMGRFQPGTYAQTYINGLLRQANGSYLLYGAAGTNITYTVWASTNLGSASWVNLGSVTSGALGGFQYIDSGAAAFRQRFYRLSYP